MNFEFSVVFWTEQKCCISRCFYVLRFNSVSNFGVIRLVVETHAVRISTPVGKYRRMNFRTFPLGNVAWLGTHAL